MVTKDNDDPVNNMLTTAFCLFLLCSPFLCSAKDTITWNSSISDFKNETLVSAGGQFELGFFTPHGAPRNRRYVGIWYYGLNPKTVVWVANRDRPVSKSSGTFGIAEDGNAKVLDRDNTTYWGTDVRNSSSINSTLQILDSGNLVLMRRDRGKFSGGLLWQSFDHPTDTFLAGMKMDPSLSLTSWISSKDPGLGNFRFEPDQDGEDRYVIRKGWYSKQWQNKVWDGPADPSDDMLSFIFSSENQNMRLVLNHIGKIQFYARQNTTAPWRLQWSEPRDRCSVYDACGKFSSCNSRTTRLCKCLPTFQPKFPNKWNGGDFSDGCTRSSSVCSGDFRSDNFLSLKMIRVGKPKDLFPVHNESVCAQFCLASCGCEAYSYTVRTMAREDSNPGLCHLWEDLNNIWENFTGGLELHLRASASVRGSKKRNCETCGTNVVPYPLSTGPSCGDRLYYSFNCSTETGKLSFITSNNAYSVVRVDSESRTFAVQVLDNFNCSSPGSEGKRLQLKGSSPFKVSRGCKESGNTSSDPFSDNGVIKEVVIKWDPPLEPACNSSQDCTDWPLTTCKKNRDGYRKCLCRESYRWENVGCTLVTELPKIFTQEKRPLNFIRLLTIATIIVILCLTCSVYYLKRRRVANRQDNRGSSHGRIEFHLYDTERFVKDLMDSGEFGEEDKKGIGVPFFDLASIAAATDNFSEANTIGQGGFGPVYKGKFPGGQQIAIKRLSQDSGQGLEEFMNEVVLIAKLQHRNLVRLLGYCIDGGEKMLLYEYMPNKSLNCFLFDRTLCVLLNWEIRFDIILGIARGLLYLHQDSRLRIIHRDMKTSNILLDEEMGPKISDFGLARICGGKKTEGNTTRVVGTFGYMSPEYILDGLFSFKSDVFSFGVILLEIISGKKNSRFFQPKQDLGLLSYAWKLWKEDMPLCLMDLTLRESCNPNEFLRCVNVGLLCVQEDPSDRPTMSTVVFMLSSETATLPTPKQPAFIVRRSTSTTASSSAPEGSNELTATIEEGR